MTVAPARQILAALLAEKGITAPGDADARHLLEALLSSQDLPAGMSRALAETLDVVSQATQPPAPGDGEAAQSDGPLTNA